MLRTRITPLSRRTAFLILLTLSVGLAGCTLASEPVPAEPIRSGPLPGEAVAANLPVTMPRASNGSLIYVEHCAACHGPDGQGGGAMAEALAEQGASVPDLTDPALVRDRAPRDWYLIITNGTTQAGGLMPPWREALTDAERWDVTSYLYTLSAPEDFLAVGLLAYQQNCAECHGDNGELEGLDDFTALAALSRKDIQENYITGGTDGIHAFDLAEEDAQALAAYVASFGFDDQTVIAIDEPAATEEAAVTDEEPPAEEQPAGEAEAEGEPDADAEAPAEETPEETVEGIDPETLMGIVAGQVLNASPGGTVPPDMEVELHGLTFDSTGQIVEFLTQTAPVDADGMYRFEDIPYDMTDGAYIVTVILDGVEFSNGDVIDPTTPLVDLPLTIYDSTTDSSVITVDNMHVIVQEQAGTLLVTELFVFSNASDKIFVTEEPISGGRRGSVGVQIPADAYNISLEDGQIGGRFIQQGSTIYDTALMMPGSQSQAIVISYLVDYDGSKELELPVLYNTGSANLLVQDGPQVRSEGLTESGSQVFQDQVFNHFVGQNIAAGEAVTFQVKTSLLSSGTIVLRIALGVLLAALAGVIGWVVWLRQDDGSLATGGLDAGQQALAQQIIDLDEAFAAGRVNRFEYEARRADLKAALAESLEED